jgi:hypothetical protein
MKSLQSFMSNLQNNQPIAEVAGQEGKPVEEPKKSPTKKKIKGKEKKSKTKEKEVK